MDAEAKQKEFIELVQIVEDLERKEFELDMEIQAKVESGASVEDLKVLSDKLSELSKLLVEKQLEKGDLEIEIQKLKGDFVK